MASIPLSPAHLLTLGMFVFGMDTFAYDLLERTISWRHEQSERFGARPASQFIGPGDDTITISGLIVPEIAGSYSSIDLLQEMGDTGDNWPLLNGLGYVMGHYQIMGMRIGHRGVMAGGIPRAVEFSLDLLRVD